MIITIIISLSFAGSGKASETLRWEEFFLQCSLDNWRILCACRLSKTDYMENVVAGGYIYEHLKKGPEAGLRLPLL